MQKTFMKYALIILSISIILAGCSKTSTTDTPQTSGAPATAAVVPGGDFTFALASTPTSLDPNSTPAAVEYRVMRNIFDSLVSETPDHQIKPWLATEWTISSDRKSYTFKLRKDVKFHDGTPFNAKAVKFNFDRIKDPATKSRMASTLIGSYESAEVIDEFTVKINLASPYEPFLRQLTQAFLGMVSPAGVEKYGDKFGLNPVGTGPFKFVKWTPNADIELVKNPDYNWAPPTASHTGPAYLDKLTFKLIPEEATRIGSVQSGQVSAVEVVPPQNMVSLKGNQDVQLHQVDSPGGPYVLMLNQTRPPWDNLKARQAVQSAIDVDTIVKTLYLGTYQRAWSPLSPTTLGYDKSLEGSVKVDINKSKQLLDELGWKPGADGIREKDGKKLTIVYADTSPNREKRNDIAAMIQQQLKPVGIDVKIEAVAVAAYTPKILANQYDIAGTSLISGDPDVLRTVYFSKFAPTSTTYGFNMGHNLDPAIDQALQDGLMATENSKREEAYKKVQQNLVQNAVGFPIYVLPYTVATAKGVSGLKFDLLAYPLFYDVSMKK
jgi:peptide/nickel transport system substrate-binding protein